MLNIKSILKQYQPITLSEMDEVALMERVDDKYTISYEELMNILDKAISAGEESVLNTSSCIIENSDMGLISKDLSIADSKNNIFSNCEIAYCAFQKKGEFGPGNITVKKDSLINCSIAHLIETKSKLFINEDSIRVFQDNVIDYLYGKKYGKATVK